MSDMEEDINDDMGGGEESSSRQPSAAAASRTQSRSTTSRSQSRLSSRSRPASRLTVSGSRPASRLSAGGGGSRLNSADKVRASRPSSSVSKKSRPSSAKSIAWEENEESKQNKDEENSEEEEDEEGFGHHEEDLGPLVIKGEEDIPKGCWFAFLQSFNGIWSTKDMNDGMDREVSVRTTVRELVIYLLFLLVIVQCMFGGTSNYRYAYTSMMQKLLVEEKFEEVKEVPDLWKFLLDDWVPAIYDNEWYNDGDNDLFPCPDGKTEKCQRSDEDKGVLYDNKLLGVPRLRQVIFAFVR